MALTLTLRSSQLVGVGGAKRIVKEYSVAASSTYSTGGDVIDFQGALNPNWIPRAAFGEMPDGFAVLNHPAGYVGVIVPHASDIDGWKMQFFQSDDAVDALDEVGAGAYPAALDADANIRIQLSGRAI